MRLAIKEGGALHKKTHDDPIGTISASARVLRVVCLDDNIFELERIEAALRHRGAGPCFEVESFSKPDPFLTRLDSGVVPDIVILDIKLGNKAPSGLTFVERVRTRAPRAYILMRSGVSDTDVMAEALKKGANDYLLKEANDSELAQRLSGACIDWLSELEGNARECDPRSVGAGPHIVGNTMKQIRRRIPRILKSAVTAVYVHGESGVGKEVVADLVAAKLPAGMPFQRINCGAISPTLLESELFGHEKGAFTGATGSKVGLIEAAAGGWIFLDEVGDLPPPAQTALLRVLGNKEILPVGAHTPRPVEVRVISATNKSIPELIARGLFREDLWQRLCEVELIVPPLRSRRSEIPELVKHFASTMTGGPYRVTSAAMKILSNASWESGNVRELRNCLRAMTENHLDGELSPRSIPERVIEATRASRPIARATRSTTTAEAEGHEDIITIAWDKNDQPTFDNLADKLLLELAIRDAKANGGQVSVRRLVRSLKIPRCRVTSRLRAITQGNPELASLLGMVATAS